MHQVAIWLHAGDPPHYAYLLGGYALGCFFLSKIPSVRANTVAEAVFNVVNPRVLPLVRPIPLFGPILAGFLDLWDTPSRNAGASGTEEPK